MRHRAQAAAVFVIAGYASAQELVGGVPAVRECSHLRAACHAGDLEACHELGVALVGTSEAFCRSERSNPAAAVRYLGMSCEGGNAEGCLRVGGMLSGFEPFVTADPAGAAVAYRKGADILRRECAEARPTSCSTLGWLIDRHEVPGTRSEASLFLSLAAGLHDAACNDGDAGACEAVARLFGYRGGRGPDRTDGVKELDALVRACDLGSMVSCDKAGDIHRFGSRGGGRGIDVDLVRALEQYERGCFLEFYFSCYQAGELHEEGIVPGADPGRAVELYEKACVLDLCEGCDRAAALFEYGRGVPHDMTRAEELRRSPCRDRP